MDLTKKKVLAMKTLNVGKNRIRFAHDRIVDIKEAITKQDIRGLYEEGAIVILPVNGRKKLEKKKRRGPGKTKMRVSHRKQDYVKLVRKLRRYLKELKRKGTINNDLYIDLRKKFKMRYFKSKASLNEYLENLKKLGVEGVNLNGNENTKTKKTKTKPRKDKQ